MTASPPVSRLVVVSDGDAALGRNRLQWVSPDPVTLEPSAQTVGPPALDIGLSPDPNMIYVGSGQGALYAVEASF